MIIIYIELWLTDFIPIISFGHHNNLEDIDIPSVRQFSHLVVSDSLWPHGLQHARLPCPSPAPGACSNSWPWSRWCHPTISSSVIPFSSCLQSFPTSGSFPVNQLFTSCGQLLEFQLPSYERPGLISFRMDWLDLLAVQGMLKSLLQHHSSKSAILWRSDFFMMQLSHPYVTTGKTIVLTTRTFVGKVMSLLLNMLSRLVITFLPRSKRLLISWLQSLSAVIFGTQENEVCHCFHCFPIYLSWSDVTGCHDLCFLNVEF